MVNNGNIINGDGFEVEVIRRPRRKTVQLRVREGRVSVFVPVKFPRSRIEEIVAHKSRWICEKISLHRQMPTVIPRAYRDGELFPYLGKDCRLVLVSGGVGGVVLAGGELRVTFSRAVKLRERYVRSKLVEWYRNRARQVVSERVNHFESIVGASPISIQVKEYKSRWGSCGFDRKIQFNWRLVLAPMRIVDYVVVHELCHLHQPNHSPEFWAWVAAVLPDYKECKTWLKVNGRTLQI